MEEALLRRMASSYFNIFYYGRERFGEMGGDG